MLAGVLASPATATSQLDRDLIRSTYAEWRGALRHADGNAACALMTPRMRDKVRLVLDPEFGWDSCAEVIGARGRSFYRAVRGTGKLSRIRVRGRRAWARPGWYFLWDTTDGWLLHYPPDRRRYPDLPTLDP